MAIDDGLRALFRARLKNAHWQTIEGLFIPGIPDANVCLDSVEVWIEFKATKRWHLKMRPEQVGWMLTRERHGGRTAVAVRRRRSDCDQLWLVRGDQAAILAELGLVPWATGGRTAGLMGLWLGGPAHWNWPAVRAALAATRAIKKSP